MRAMWTFRRSLLIFIVVSWLLASCTGLPELGRRNEQDGSQAAYQAAMAPSPAALPR